LDDPALAVRKQALLSIADVQARELRDRLLGLLSDPELEVRQLAVMALGEITDGGDPEVVGRLAGLLSAGSPAVRYQAILAYANLRPGHCEGDLKKALTDEDHEIRKLALRLIDEVLLPGTTELKPVTLEQIRRCCNDDHPYVALLGQLICGELAVEAPRGRIIEVVRRNLKVTEPRDEQWAVELCGRLQLQEAVSALRRRAYGVLGFSGDPFRWVALGALARLGDEGALQRLLKNLQSRSYMLRVLAVEALGRSARTEALQALSERRSQLEESAADRPADECELIDLALGNLRTDIKGAI
jgi:HEAT repeat protein